VVATGRNVEGQRNVSGWTGIIQVAAGGYYTLGLKADGTVVATGDNTYGQCNVAGWRLGQPSQGMFYVIPSRKGGGAVIYLE
jgi:alpha-tubulin suppressor-like RCC1 family protein